MQGKSECHLRLGRRPRAGRLCSLLPRTKRTSVCGQSPRSGASEYSRRTDSRWCRRGQPGDLLGSAGEGSCTTRYLTSSNGAHRRASAIQLMVSHPTAVVSCTVSARLARPAQSRRFYEQRRVRCPDMNSRSIAFASSALSGDASSGTAAVLSWHQGFDRTPVFACPSVRSRPAGLVRPSGPVGPVLAALTRGKHCDVASCP